MKLGEYIVIKVADIEWRISECSKAINEISGNSKSKNSISALNALMMQRCVYETLLANPTDLYGVVEDACNTYARHEDLAVKDYLNNLEIATNNNTNT